MIDYKEQTVSCSCMPYGNSIWISQLLSNHKKICYMSTGLSIPQIILPSFLLITTTMGTANCLPIETLPDSVQEMITVIVIMHS